MNISQLNIDFEASLNTLRLLQINEQQAQNQNSTILLYSPSNNRSPLLDNHEVKNENDVWNTFDKIQSSIPFYYQNSKIAPKNT